MHETKPKKRSTAISWALASVLVLFGSSGLFSVASANEYEDTISAEEETVETFQRRGGGYDDEREDWRDRRDRRDWREGRRERRNDPRDDYDWRERRRERGDWDRRHERRQIDVGSWAEFWASVLFPGYNYYPPYPRVGEGRYRAPAPDYRSMPQPYYMRATTGLNFRATPGGELCGTFPAGAYVPVVTMAAPRGSSSVWATIFVDESVRRYMTNSRCFRQNYVFSAGRYLN